MARTSKQAAINIALVAVPLLYLGILYFLPIGGLIAFGSGQATYREVLTSGFYWEILGNTFLFAGKVTLLALLVAYPISAFACVSSPRIAKIVIFCSTIPLWTSILARSYAWFTVLDRRGIVNELLRQLHLTERPLSLSHTSFAALIGSVYIMLPLMVVTLYASMRAIDLNVVRAARTLGAGPMQAFTRAFLPLSIPGVVSGCLLVYIVSLGFYVTPALLGAPSDRTFSMLIAQQIGTMGDFEAAAALSAVLLLSTVLFLILFGVVVGFEQFIGRGSGVSVPLSRGYGRIFSRIIDVAGPLIRWAGSRHFWSFFVVLALAYIVLPYFALVPMSLSGADYLQFPPDPVSIKWYVTAFHDSRWLSAGVSSIIVAIGATLLATTVGLMAAVGIREMPRRSAQVILTLLLAPAMVPTMIYSVASYLGAAKVGLVDTYWGLVLAHSALGLPFVVIICATGLGGIKQSIEQAARSLGAGRFVRFFRITLPLIVPSVLAGSLVAFQTSFDEVIVSLFLSGVETRTLPKAMWTASTQEITPIIPAVAVLVLLVILTVALCVYVLARVYRPRG
jgi:putative spermidine/putrescine transport system permease protein